MQQYHLNELKEITQGEVLGDSSRSFSRILTDSRNLSVSESSLFIALVGERHNGHSYLTEMYTKGVRCFMVSEHPTHIDQFAGAGFLLVNNSLSALQKVASFHRKTFNIPTIGITGSNGKTIVKEWLAYCLSNRYKIARSPKSFNSQLGVPLSVWLLNAQTELGIFEAGISKPGEMSILGEIIRPTDGIFTNIGEAHQKNFSSLKEKVAEKTKLFKHCKNIYFCSDYKEIEEAISDTFSSSSTNLYSWSMLNNKAKAKVNIEGRNTNQTLISFQNASNTLNFTLPFTDSASIENCIQTINYLVHNNFTEKEINNLLSDLHPLAMRLEQVKGKNNCLLINDTYNSDINSLGIALDFLHQQTSEKKSLILSDIQQSSLSDEALYSKVSDLIRQAKIHQFVGIGESICKYQKLFDFTNTSFYKSTQEFLSSPNSASFEDEAILIKAARSFKFESIVSALSAKNHNTVLEISLDKLIHNLNHYRSILSAKSGIMVMVKAFAYGSGSFEIANLLQHQHVEYLGVAFTDEGVELRQSGITLPIMVMSPDKDDLSNLIDHNLEPELYSFSSLKNFVLTAKKMQVTNYPVHIKLDTGMHRLGFQTEDIDELIKILKNTNTIRIQGIFSHLAASDNPDHDSFTHLQIERFSEIYTKISVALNIKPKRHILNSAGIERFPEAHFELVRLGIGLHGISTSKNLHPTSTLKTHISQIKNIQPDETVGYNRREKITGTTTIAILPIGYADGLDRKLGNGNGNVVIRGHKVPFVGDICMDMSMINITGIKCTEGEELVVFGPENPITNLAKQIGTIPYEILTNVSSRVKRLYIKE